MKKNIDKLKYAKGVSRKSFSWLTDDAHEFALRRERGLKEPMTVKRTAQGHKIFTTFEVRRSDIHDAATYRVEIRSLNERLNYCNCPDYHKNFIGTCKHIEKVLATLGADASKTANSPFAEIFIDHANGDFIRIMRPQNLPEAVEKFLHTYLNEAGNIKFPEFETLSVLVADLEKSPKNIKTAIRVSSSVHKWLYEAGRKLELEKMKKLCGDKFRSHGGCANFLKHNLYDYQIDGMLHLAFTGRAMLADEMGLGKTVQAIAAAHVMRDLFNVRRVLLVTPVSLKIEWEEQIKKFTDLSFHTVYGGRKERLRAYTGSDSFFLICNYEQVIKDIEDVNVMYQPDLVILDEAQRIKNWRTKSARAIKKLNAKFAFVLTGTPIENKIDELYSITEFIDPAIFGSLFRFNRKFYDFDQDGRVRGLKNLRELHETIKPVMLRRRKDEVEDQLPERIDNNYFVKMTDEQKLRYEDYQAMVVKLLSQTKHRPLSDEEFKKLQGWLACMRMLCDTVYILDKEITESPKIEELVNVLNDIWEDAPDRKVVVFSEWVAMLQLAREQFMANGIGFAWHTGEVGQLKRRDEINRFKNDPACKVFLSTDSGGLGLNLQIASVVVNLDLPWNPAKLEQRIARAWRKHQKNAVNVVNFISEDTIEHRMLATLAFKSGIADGVLDGRGNIDELEKPNAKAGFLKRLSEIMQTPHLAASEVSKTVPAASKTDIKEKIRQNITVKAADSLRSFKLLEDKATGEIRAMLAVTFEKPEDILPRIVSAVAEDKAGENTTEIERKIAVIDDKTNELLLKLASMGIISINNEAMKEMLAPANTVDQSMKLKIKEHELRKKLFESAEKQASRLMKMTEVLIHGGFPEDARKPAAESLILSAKCLIVSIAEKVPEKVPEQIDAENTRFLKEKFPTMAAELSNLALAASSQYDFLTPEDLLASSKRILAESENILASHHSSESKNDQV